MFSLTDTKGPAISKHLLSLRAGGEGAPVVLSSDVDLGTSLESDVPFETMLCNALREEVVEYMFDVGKLRPRDPCRCEICPFRRFNRREHLQSHMQYHTAPLYTAAGDSQSQHDVVKSLYRFDRVSDLCTPSVSHSRRYLKQSASLIRKWNIDAPPQVIESAARSNMPHLVFVLTDCGPQFWFRAKCVDTVRITDKVYYTSGFEKLLIGLALVSHGKCSGVVDRLYQRWSCEGVSPFLLGQGKSFIPDILRQVFTDPAGDVQVCYRRLMALAVARGEFIALTHDASYKFLFSVLGQQKMSQKQGEIHAGHTLMGLTGA